LLTVVWKKQFLCDYGLFSKYFTAVKLSPKCNIFLSLLYQKTNVFDVRLSGFNPNGSCTIVKISKKLFGLHTLSYFTEHEMTKKIIAFPHVNDVVCTRSFSKFPILHMRKFPPDFFSSTYMLPNPKRNVALQPFINVKTTLLFQVQLKEGLGNTTDLQIWIVVLDCCKKLWWKWTPDPQFPIGPVIQEASSH
jgi:hypothetical protein